jgi:hypothetical protein
LIIVKKWIVLDYGLSNATFETPNHAFTWNGVLGMKGPNQAMLTRADGWKQGILDMKFTLAGFFLSR